MAINVRVAIAALCSRGSEQVNGVGRLNGCYDLPASSLVCGRPVPERPICLPMIPMYNSHIISTSEREVNPKLASRHTRKGGI